MHLIHLLNTKRADDTSNHPARFYSFLLSLFNSNFSNMLHTRFTILFILGLIFPAKTQNTPFDIQLTSINITGVGGLQAYEFGQVK